MAVLDRFDLTGRTAVVTGSTRGLGRAFARALAEAGANVVIVGRNAVGAAEVEQELGTLGVGTLVVLADMTVRADIERLLVESTERFGRVDVLVNNAGACIHKPALEVTDEEWRDVMGVNLDGLWIASQVFGRHMIDAGGGVIVNIGSMSASIVTPRRHGRHVASRRVGTGGVGPARSGSPPTTHPRPPSTTSRAASPPNGRRTGCASTRSRRATCTRT
jgi:NAD(P)-dependent dehydrogenase (short-subunit alcohol dehydrogenase family)